MPAPGSKRYVESNRPKPVSQDAQNPPKMAGVLIPSDLLPDLGVGLAAVLGRTRYAVIGGTALALLGSTRPTSDIDLFVPSTGLEVTKKFVDSNDIHFGTYKSIRSTMIWYRGLNGQKYRVNIWEPKEISLSFSKSSADYVTINGARVLKPALLLDHKCKLWTQEVLGGGHVNWTRDARDVVFLLEYMGKKRLRTTDREVSHATPEFFSAFLPYKRESEPLFCAIGLLKTRETDTAVPKTVVRSSAKRAPS